MKIELNGPSFDQAQKIVGLHPMDEVEKAMQCALCAKQARLPLPVYEGDPMCWDCRINVLEAEFKRAGITPWA